MRRYYFALALLLTVLGYGSMAAPAHAAPAQQPGRAPLSQQLQRIVELVNARRREANLRPLSVHPTLVACAQQYSAVQAAQSGINHTGPDGSTPGQRLTSCGYRWKHFGENLAAGFVTADEVVTAWMNSPSHRKVLLHAKVTEIGVGTTHRDDDPNRYYDYYVLEVGIRK